MSASTPLKVKGVGSKPDCKEDFHVLSSSPTHSFFQGTFVRKWLKQAVVGLSFSVAQEGVFEKTVGQGTPKPKQHETEVGMCVQCLRQGSASLSLLSCPMAVPLKTEVKNDCHRTNCRGVTGGVEGTLPYSISWGWEWWTRSS